MYCMLMNDQYYIMLVLLTWSNWPGGPRYVGKEPFITMLLLTIHDRVYTCTYV